MTSQRESAETLRAEALALLAANQAARQQGFWLLTGSFAWIGVAVTVALALKRAIVLVPLAPLSLLTLSLVFQTYSEVSVLGAARRVLEVRLREAGDAGLVYETVVAPIRQRTPLVVSVRMLQTLGAFVHLGAVAAGVVAAANQTSALIVGTALITLLAAVSAGLSYRDMLRSSAVAGGALDESPFSQPST